MNERKQRIEALFAEALALDTPEERADCLDRGSGDDPTVRREVEELLRAAGEAGGFLAATASECDGNGQPPVALAATVGETTEMPGTIIGHYKLLEKIGEGGMGVVYMAEQREPVVRKVALKIIKLGMDTRQVIARFEAERQALAVMDHPNIAKVFDAGATETGRPYFVMEPVRGVPLTRFCDENRLPPRERLELMTKVCQAVQHAHQKGIIHRDLKPSNVLVTLHDGVPVPKVIDFGIAKATQQELTDKTLHTLFQQFIGTPAYMSPEQAAMTSLDIDTRSDIYSLGVLLYELLTGTTPFDSSELLKAGLDEMRRTIREKEPERPSTRLTRELARQRVSTKPEIRNPKSEIDADLDWIVMKCLDKDRARRYETANGLAADIQRHLHNEPVVARPPSAVYRLQKLVRRNRVVFAIASVLSISLILGLMMALWLLGRERRATQRALQAEQTARREAIQREKVARFLGEIATGAMPESAEGADGELLRSILDPAMERLQSSETGQPSEYWNLGLAYQGLGDLARAETLIRGALRTAQQAFGPDNASVSEYREELVDLLLRQEKPERAEEILGEALNQAVEGKPEYVALLASRGSVRARQGKWKEAAADFQQAIAREADNHEFYHSLAPLLIESGAIQDYLQHRQATLAQFATTTDPIVAERMAKDCLLMPMTAEGMAVVDRWTATAMQAGQQHPEWRWFQLARALAEFRRGQFASASDLAHQVAASTGEPTVREVEAGAVLAMAFHRLGQKAQAAKALAQASDVAARQLPKPGNRDLGAGWNDWIIAHTLLREARQLMEQPVLSEKEAK